jgi:hypothetical protein
MTFARRSPLSGSGDEPVVFRSALADFYAQGIRMQQILGVAARFGLLRLVRRCDSGSNRDAWASGQWSSSHTAYRFPPWPR